MIKASFIYIRFRGWFWSYEIVKNNKLDQLVRDSMCNVTRQSSELKTVENNVIE